MGRRALPPEEKKRRVFRFRLTDGKYKRLEQLAEKMGLTPQGYLNSRIK